jgi:hypothetical protein
VFFVAAAGAKICTSICLIMDHPFPVACHLSAKFTVVYALSQGNVMLERGKRNV